MTGPQGRATLKQRATTERDVAVSAWIRRWPPVLWLLVSLGSLFVVEASGRTWLSVTGIVLMVVAFGLAVHLALSRRQGAARPPLVFWPLAAVGGLYALVALAASLSGWQYGAAALLAALIPGTAVALLAATVRSRTRAVGDRLVDASAADGADPVPAQGFDDATPLGTTSEHSDAEGDPIAAARARRRAPVPPPPARRRQCAGRAAPEATPSQRRHGLAPAPQRPTCRNMTTAPTYSR